MVVTGKMQNIPDTSKSLLRGLDLPEHCTLLPHETCTVLLEQRLPWGCSGSDLHSDSHTSGAAD